MVTDPRVGTKRERRELARQEREALRRRIERRRRARPFIVGAVVVALVLGGTVALLSSRGDAGLPGMLTDEAPWPANQEQLGSRLEDAGLPALAAMEQLDFHIHQHLDLFVNGNRVEVPADIGIAPEVGLAVLHTHDVSGIIHVEAPERRDFTLGDLFDVWGIRLTSSCPGGYCDSDQKSLSVVVDGQPVQGDPRQVILRDREEIVVAYGTSGELPDPVPSSYAFPKGL